MKTVRDACEPHPKALSIRLSEQIEQLDALIAAEDDGASFFERTHVTDGMLDLLNEGIARLAGASSQAVFHLKQSMGGGKTHLLVGFGLLAKHPDLRRTRFSGVAHSEAFESADVAAFNGRNSPSHFFGVRSPPNSEKPLNLASSGSRGQKPRTRRPGSNYFKAIGPS